MKPLDTELNRVILEITRAMFPQGFDVSRDAPETIEGLRAHVARTGRMIVTDANSETTIYGRASVNVAFRAWHDATHLETGADFSLEGESAVCEAQCKRVALHASPQSFPAQARRFAEIIRAEIIGQARHFATHGVFPVAQAAFVAAYMQQPNAALARVW